LIAIEMSEEERGSEGGKEGEEKGGLLEAVGS